MADIGLNNTDLGVVEDRVAPPRVRKTPTMKDRAGFCWNCGYCNASPDLCVAFTVLSLLYLSVCIIFLMVTAMDMGTKIVDCEIASCNNSTHGIIHFGSTNQLMPKPTYIANCQDKIGQTVECRYYYAAPGWSVEPKVSHIWDNILFYLMIFIAVSSIVFYILWGLWHICCCIRSEFLYCEQSQAFERHIQKNQ